MRQTYRQTDRQIAAWRNSVEFVLCKFAAVTLLLALCVYQVIVSDKLPSSGTSVPIIGTQTIDVKNVQTKIKIVKNVKNVTIIKKTSANVMKNVTSSKCVQLHA